MEIEVVRMHIKDMLDVRGDDTSYIEEHGDAVDHRRYYNEIITLDTDKTVIFFAFNKAKELKDREKSAADMIARYDGRLNYIIVLYQAPSSPILNQFQSRNKDLQSQGGMLHLFYVRELMYNPMKHVLVPKHEKISPEEIAALLTEYKVRHAKNLPIIVKDDVIARWLGLRPGDVVKITRHNDTSGTYIYYRYCT